MRIFSDFNEIKSAVGTEIGVLAGALLERVGLELSAVPVVLGGGIGASGDPLLLEGVRGASDSVAVRRSLAKCPIPSWPGICAALR